MTGTVLSAGVTAVYTSPYSSEAFVLVGEDKKKQMRSQVVISAMKKQTPR